jgi:FMN-dependent oxidoreductase (nitrilotriacetate monooxygenase family)
MTTPLSRAHRPFLTGLILEAYPSTWWKQGATARDPYDLQRYIGTARAADAAGIDILFLADGVYTSASNPRVHLEPVTLLTAIARETSRIGLVGTISTSFSEPYNVARQVLSLHQLSNGRAGWNIVTSAAGAVNFSQGQESAHADRYDRADEHATVVQKLWGSWQPGAIIKDAEQQRFFDTSKVHRIDHEGRYFTVEGPLNISDEGLDWPLIVQAGSSADGIRLGAKHADLVFTTGAIDPEENRKIRDRYRATADGYGRKGENLPVLPGVTVVVGATEEEAREQLAEVRGTVDLDKARNSIRLQFDVDLDHLSYDDVIPLGVLPDPSQIRGRQSRYATLRTLIENGTIRTVRELLEYHHIAAGHLFLVGTPETIAADLAQRWRDGTVDGFNFMGTFANYKYGLGALTEGILPELRKLGVLDDPPRIVDPRSPEAATAPTLRKRLGLERDWEVSSEPAILQEQLQAS